MKEIRNHRHVHRNAEKSRHELIKLGPHLLNDLGFDSKGYPLKTKEALSTTKPCRPSRISSLFQICPMRPRT
jgi:hypothetical protein